jgi:DNA-directed RNA polymerase specialized sigma24 family protein
MSKPQVMTISATGATRQERLALRAKRESEEAARRYERGQSIRQIAKAMGLGYGTIHNRLRAAGVTMRGRGGPNNRHVDVGL